MLQVYVGLIMEKPFGVDSKMCSYLKDYSKEEEAEGIRKCIIKRTKKLKDYRILFKFRTRSTN